MTTKTNNTMFVFLSLVMGASLLMISIPYADAVSVPDVRVDWESHDDSSKGAKTVIAKKDPSLTNPGTDYWWAKTFTSWGVYSVWIDEGAVGAGTVKYNPIGGGATQYVGFMIGMKILTLRATALVQVQSLEVPILKRNIHRVLHGIESLPVHTIRKL